MGCALAPCGTPSAYQRHSRHHEPIDDACRAAAREYQQQLRAGRPATDRARDLTADLDDQTAREAHDRNSRLAAGIPDYDRWPTPTHPRPQEGTA